MDFGWLAVLLGVYFIPTALAAFIIYKIYRTFTKGRQLGFESMPKLTQVTSKNLPATIVKKIEAVDQKAKKLLGYYDNKQIKDEAIMGENQFLVKKILNEDLPEAIADYQRLDNIRANEMAVGTTGKTAYQLLNDYLDTINEQFDDMLDAMYEQNAQKLLISNRYLQSRFENQDSELNILMKSSHSAATSASPQLEYQTVSEDNIIIPPPVIKSAESVEIKIEK